MISHKNKSLLVVFSFLVITVFASCAKKTQFEGLERYKLSNGLEVFTAENHTVPLVYIEIAFKAGANCQTPENAGLFHMYEHMMFKGNKLYPTAASVQRAITDMGVSSWNGTTGVDCVNYFFTIPKDQLENGLAFWNAAIRSPLLDEVEFENEKKVVLSEINGQFADTGFMYYSYILKNLFPDAPYRIDAGGSTQVIQNATIAQLKDIQSRYYIPSNAALFVGGDINPEEVKELVEKIYGSWSNNGNSAPKKGKEQNKNPLSTVKYAIMPDEKISPQIAKFAIDFRGPDADFDLKDTYVADYLLQLLADPDGAYLKTLTENQLYHIPGKEYLSSSYGTTRANGVFEFAGIMLSPESDLPSRVESILSEIQTQIIPSVAEDASLYTDEKRLDIARKLKDSNTIAMQTAEGFLSNLRFWWCCTSPEYIYTYDDYISKVTQKDVQNFVKKYFANKKPLVTVYINKDVYEQVKDFFEAKDYELISEENSFWWTNESFAPDLNKIPKSNPDSKKEEEIYVPQKGFASSKTYEFSSVDDIGCYKLNNGIPVFLKIDESKKIDSINIAVRGGIERLSPEISGLENALFNMMAKTSQNYDYASRQSLYFDTRASFSASSFQEGSVLHLSTLDSYFDDAVPVLIDSFLNPSYEETVYDSLMMEYKNAVQTTLNDPQALLSYELTRKVFKDHPYETRVGVTPDSIENISLKNLQILHKDILEPANIFVVAVGCMDHIKLLDILNETLGKLEPTDYPIYEPFMDVPPVEIKGNPFVVMFHPKFKGTGFAVRVFEAPSVLSSDYLPAKLACSMYNTVLYNVVREHYGACYTPGSYFNWSFAPLGQDYFYRLSDPGNLVSYEEEARSYMQQGKIIDSVDENGNYVFSSVEERLSSYKNASKLATYLSAQTTNGIAYTMVQDLLMFDALNVEEELYANIDSISSVDVLYAFQKYWCDSPSQWWLMLGDDFKDKIELSD